MVFISHSQTNINGSCKYIQVISGHLGWVRSIAFDPGNEWFCTGSADRTIKVTSTIIGTFGHLHIMISILLWKLAASSRILVVSTILWMHLFGLII